MNILHGSCSERGKNSSGKDGGRVQRAKEEGSHVRAATAEELL